MERRKIQIRKIYLGYDCGKTKMSIFTLKKTATITTGGILGAGFGFFTSGPPGAVAGMLGGCAAVSAPIVGGSLIDAGTKATEAYQHYILFEYGPKSHRKSDDFTYSYYMRIQFGFNGYSFFVGNTRNYLRQFNKINICEFANEKQKYECNGNKEGMTKVINAVKDHEPNHEHNTKYVMSGIFALDVWKVRHNL